MRSFVWLTLLSGCITFDSVNTFNANVLQARCAVDGDCSSDQVCLDARCVSLAEDILFLVTGVEGTSTQRDPNGYPRVVDRLAIIGEGLKRVTSVRLDDAELSVEVVSDKRLHALLPADLASGDFTLRVEHPTAGVSTHGVTFARGTAGPKGPRGLTGDQGLTGHILPCISGGYRFTDLVDTQLACGAPDVTMSMDGAPLTTAPASFVATAAEQVTAMQLENTAAGGVALKVNGRDDLQAVKLPVYIKRVDVNVIADASTLIALCDETLGKDIMLSGICQGTGTTMFADCPVQDTTGTNCLSGDNQEAYGIRCKTSDANTMVAWLTCLRVR